MAWGAIHHAARRNQYHVESLTVKGDTDLASVLLLEVVAIRLDCGAVGEEEIVTHDPGLPAAVTLFALTPITCASRRKEAGAITQDGTTPRLVEGDPQFDCRTEGLETHPGIVLEILNELLLVQ